LSIVDTRTEWFALMIKISDPVLSYGSEKRLKSMLPPHNNLESHTNQESVSHFEALARTLAGIAPWLELDKPPESEINLQTRFRLLARMSLESIFDKNSIDYVDFKTAKQELVEAAHLVLAFNRAPKQLWELLSDELKKKVILGLLDARKINPYKNNWILFSGIIDAFLIKKNVIKDGKRIQTVINEFDSWYVGDGCYKDGPHFHLDYYNSIAIHPMILAIVELVADKTGSNNAWDVVLLRAQRYSTLLERMISPEGALPTVGRSLCYRTGVLHLLADLTCKELLPECLGYGEVQSAMSSVIRRQFAHTDSWDHTGFLKIGWIGHQENLAEFYISTGSLYMCLMAFLPLGLSAKHDFWTVEAQHTNIRMYSGLNCSTDKYMN